MEGSSHRAGALRAVGLLCILVCICCAPQREHPVTGTGGLGSRPAAVTTGSSETPAGPPALPSTPSPCRCLPQAPSLAQLGQILGSHSPWRLAMYDHAKIAHSSAPLKIITQEGWMDTQRAGPGGHTVGHCDSGFMVHSSNPATPWTLGVNTWGASLHNCERAGEGGKLPVPSAWFCCKPKNALRNESQAGRGGARLSPSAEEGGLQIQGQPGLYK